MLRFLVIFLALLVAFSLSEQVEFEGESAQDKHIAVRVNTTATMKMPAKASYERSVQNAKTKKDERQIYRVCNGKNKGKCGFWENKKTKKKVASGATSYDKAKKALVIKKIKKTDFGMYKTHFL